MFQIKIKNTFLPLRKRNLFKAIEVKSVMFGLSYIISDTRAVAKQ